MDMNTAFPNKMKELILYVSEKLSDDKKFCSTKLNKVLFFTDFLRYRIVKKTITGKEYWKLPFGPAPKCFVPLREEMINEGSLEIILRDYWGKSQKVPVAKRKPNLAVFTADEISLVDFVIEQLRPLDANECSLHSHKYLELFWDLAEYKESIPHGLALVAYPEDDSVEQMEYCEEMQRRAEKWLKATA